MTETKTTFNKIWEKEFDKDFNWQPLDGYKKVVKITTVDKDDLTDRRKWDYWEEIIYKFKLATPDWHKDAELIFQENKKALWKIKVWWQEYVIWKFIREDGVSCAFKYNDEYWCNIEKKRNKNDEIYFKFKFSYKDEIQDEDIELEEVEF